MKSELTMELYVSPMLERNLDKYGQISDQCICCGKPMKPNNQLTVHMNGDWVAVHHSVSEDQCLELTGSDSQGAFPIGNDCAKKMKGFVS